MSEFMEMATAIDKVLTMLKEGGCQFPYVRIFHDGSGSLVVEAKDRDTTRTLLQQHGIDLGHGYRQDKSNNDYYFELDIEALNNYCEVVCPHCGEEITSVLP